MKLCVISPKCSRESAAYLAELFNAPYLSAERMDYTEFDVVINYGSSNAGMFRKVINKPQAVKLCVNKISTLKRVSHGIPWTKDPNKALSWLQNDGYVVSRATEVGSKSKGIIICSSEEEWRNTPARFWTRYFPHSHEVRINVYKEKILTVYEKVEVDGLFEFRLLEITGEQPQVSEMIHSIYSEIGIDIYGMDVLVNDEGKYCLLEVNSGAVLHPETAAALVKAIKKDLKNDC